MHRRLALAALPLSALLLAGCTAGTPTAGADDGGDGSSSAAAGGGAGDGLGLGSAAEAALELTGSGTVVAIERDDSGAWEVTVAAADGRETEVRVIAKDGDLLGRPSQKPVDADDDADNVRRIQAAELDFSDAAKAASAQAPGEIVELALDDENGVVAWEAELLDGDTKHEVKLDAATGDPLPGSGVSSPADDD
ncbi:PepSY domain-containing protein [Schumannella sp. 10F1B-5-1]|uniref:PepSY domain-containing protein n=1 Tax=Schumannella sp. 10F1B-5-1 TaxID=2590780 RepID=UPI0011315091|nr:PepSY domain-containing protein [Schumannella sp. 10F1B-5-1]TPW76980.1 PepSY domain-containing protein [Schumannella sp. 10F1B-5-1]